MLGCRTGSNQNAAACGWVFLAVKPQMMPDMLENVSGVLRRRAAPPASGSCLSVWPPELTMERIRTLAQGEYPVIRMMPNTPRRHRRRHDSVLLRGCDRRGKGRILQAALRRGPAGGENGQESVFEIQYVEDQHPITVKVMVSHVAALPLF